MGWDWTAFEAVATGVGAAGTVVAAGAAITAGVYARRAWVSQSDAADSQRDATTVVESQWQDELEGRKRAQAELVAGWYVEREVDGARTYKEFIRVRNSSTVPVYDVTFRLFEAPISDVVDSREVADGLFPRVIPPETTKRVFVNEHWYSEVDVDALDRHTLLVEISFTDAAGVRWIRGHRGNLDRFNPTGTPNDG